MTVYERASHEELVSEYERLEQRIAVHQAQGYQLSMARGKPGPELLELDRGFLDAVNSSSDCHDGPLDCLNYGGLEGILSARVLMAELFEVEPDQVLLYGQSSLQLMFDLMMHAVLFGVCGHTPFKDQGEFKVLCPSPGYDRHFALSEKLGAQLIPIAMDERGPLLEEIKEYAQDPAVKAIWCVPKYSNPTGISYAPELVEELAYLKFAAEDFRIYWDNAYIEHHLYEDLGLQDSVPHILQLCEEAAQPDKVYMISSTSKIAHAGSGLAALASSYRNIQDFRSTLSYMTVGHDKVNQLRHVRYFKDLSGLRACMKRRAAVLRPKFELVDTVLGEELKDSPWCSWTKPRGGYFISFEAYPHTAKRVVELASSCGIEFTPAGSCYPYGFDPEDKHIRLAPSFPSLEELEIAMRVFCDCVKCAALERLLQEKEV